MFFCEFCEIFKNNFFIEHLQRMLLIVKENNKILKQFSRFLINNTFISNTRLKLQKNQIKTKEHPEAELKIICFLHLCCHRKLVGHILKNV